MKRENRFLALIESDGKILPVHVANSGRMKELLIPGAKVWWQPKDTPKTRGLLWMAETNGFLVVLSAVSANGVFEGALKSEGFAPLKDYEMVQREYAYHESRFDFLLQSRKTGRPVLCEVKSVNLCEKGLALFPDAPTSRGKKHIEELEKALNHGYEALVVFVGLRPILAFRPMKNGCGFCRGFKKAVGPGVKVLACKTEWSEQGCKNLLFVPSALESEV